MERQLLLKRTGHTGGIHPVPLHLPAFFRVVVVTMVVVTGVLWTPLSEASQWTPAGITELYTYYDEQLPGDTKNPGYHSSLTMDYAYTGAVVRTLNRDHPDLTLLASYWTGLFLDYDFTELSLSPELTQRLPRLRELAEEYRQMARDAELVSHHPGFTPKERAELLAKAAPRKRHLMLYRHLLDFLKTAQANPGDWRKLRALTLESAQTVHQQKAKVLKDEYDLLETMRRALFDDVAEHKQEIIRLETLRRDMVEKHWALMVAIVASPDPAVLALDMPEMAVYAEANAQYIDAVLQLVSKPAVRKNKRLFLRINSTYSIRGAALWGMIFASGGETFLRHAILASISRGLIAATYWDRANYTKVIQMLELTMATDPLQLNAMQRLADLYYESGRYDEAARLYDRIMKLDAGRMSNKAHFERVSGYMVVGDFEKARQAAREALDAGIEDSNLKNRILDYLVYSTVVLEGEKPAEAVYVRYKGKKPNWDEVPLITGWWGCQLAEIADYYQFSVGELHHRGYCYLPSSRYHPTIKKPDGQERNRTEDWEALVAQAQNMPLRPGPTDRALELTNQGFQWLDQVSLEAWASKIEQDPKQLYSDKRTSPEKEAMRSADQAFREAYFASPWWPEGYYNYAVMMAAQGSVRDAISLMESYLEIESGAASGKIAQARKLISQWKRDEEKYFDARK